MEASKRDRAMFGFAAVLLVVTFIGHLMPSDEAPSPTLKTLSILIELALVVGLVGMAPRVLRSAPDAPGRVVWIVLLVAGLISATGIFIIRLSGGPRVELPSRTSNSSRPAEGLPKQLHELIQSTTRQGEKLAGTRWAKLFMTQDPVQIKTLTRHDLQEAREIFGEMRQTMEQIVKIFAEAESKKIDLSTASSEASLMRPDTWRISLEGMNASYEYMGLIDQHWEEWIADPLGTGGDLKAWRLEVMRLGEIAADASKKIHTLSASGTLPTPASGDAAALPKKLHDLVYSWGPAVMKLQHERWLTTGGAERRKLPRKELLEASEKLRSLLAYTDQILAVFAEAQSKGIEIPKDPDEPALARQEYWRAFRQAYGAFADSLNLIDQNFDEYVAHPSFPEAKSDQKPWQREVLRLEDVRNAQSKKMETLRDPAKGLLPELKALIASSDASRSEMIAARWNKVDFSDAAQRRTLTPQDVKDFAEINSRSIECCKRIVELLVQAASERIDVSTVAGDKVLIRPDFWQTLQKTAELRAERIALREKHWEEWLAAGDPKTESNLKPWQADLKRLTDEGDVIQKQFEAILKSGPVVSSTQVAPAPDPAKATALVKELRDLIELWQASVQKSSASRWGNVDPRDPAKKKTLTRRDFADAREFQRQQIEYQDRIAKLFSEAESQGIDVAGVSTDIHLVGLKFWRRMQEVDTNHLKQRKLIDQHWKEWLTSPATVNAKSKPWEREMARLQEEDEAGQRRFTAFPESKPLTDAPPVTRPGPTAPPVPPSSAVAPLPSQNSTVPPIPPTSSAGPFLPPHPTASPPK